MCYRVTRAKKTREHERENKTNNLMKSLESLCNGFGSTLNDGDFAGKGGHVLQDIAEFRRKGDLLLGEVGKEGIVSFDESAFNVDSGSLDDGFGGEGGSGGDFGVDDFLKDDTVGIGQDLGGDRSALGKLGTLHHAKCIEWLGAALVA